MFAAASRPSAWHCAAEQPIYGINTGFGMLANVRIPDDHLVELQENLILFHCAGIGENLDDRSVRLILVLKILSLAQGYSGVTPILIVALSKLLNHEVYPGIPARLGRSIGRPGAARAPVRRAARRGPGAPCGQGARRR